MGKEKQDRIRGLGLGPTPTEILGMPTTWHSKEVLKLQEKVDSIQGIITNLQASDSTKSFKVKELEDRLACLEGLFNKRNGLSKQSIMQEKLPQQHDKSQNSHGSIAWEGDAFSEVMGKEKHGLIFGLDLGPTPTEILGMPTTWHSEEVLKLQEKVDSMHGIITNLQASDSAKSFKVKELEDRLACLDGLFNKHNGPSKQQEAPKNLHRNPTVVFEKFQELSFC
ncbi:hypothetical protein Ancab_006217 [Ancistrocladus abbreviatus]